MKLSNEMTMQPSDIVVSKSDTTPDPVEEQRSVRLREAYLQEKRVLENLDIELNRSRIIIVDETGKILKLGLLLEH